MNVLCILHTIFTPSVIHFKNVHQLLVKNEITSVFSKKKSNGRFSDFAVKMFNFPSDAKGVDAVTDDDDESNDTVV